MTNNPPTITTSASTASTSSSNPSEVVVWKNIKTKGFWHKRMVQAEELTNYNVILNDVKIPWSVNFRCDCHEFTFHFDRISFWFHMS